jgi:hypothetical protein
LDPYVPRLRSLQPCAASERNQHENRAAYPYCRLNITRNNGNGLTQLAELELWADDVVLPAGAAGNAPTKNR